MILWSGQQRKWQCILCSKEIKPPGLKTRVYAAFLAVRLHWAPAQLPVVCADCLKRKEDTKAKAGFVITYIPTEEDHEKLFEIVRSQLGHTLDKKEYWAHSFTRDAPKDWWRTTKTHVLEPITIMFDNFVNAVEQLLGLVPKFPISPPAAPRRRERALQTAASGPPVSPYDPTSITWHTVDGLVVRIEVAEYNFKELANDALKQSESCEVKGLSSTDMSSSDIPTPENSPVNSQYAYVRSKRLRKAVTYFPSGDCAATDVLQAPAIKKLDAFHRAVLAALEPLDPSPESCHSVPPCQIEMCTGHTGVLTGDLLRHSTGYRDACTKKYKQKKKKQPAVPVYGSNNINSSRSRKSKSKSQGFTESDAVTLFSNLMQRSQAWISFNLITGYEVTDGGEGGCTIAKDACPSDFCVVGPFHVVRKVRRPPPSVIFDSVTSIRPQVEVFQYLASPATSLEITTFLRGACETGHSASQEYAHTKGSATRRFNLPLMLYFLEYRSGERHIPDSRVFGDTVFDVLVAAMLERDQAYERASKCSCPNVWIDYLQPTGCRG